MTSKTYKIDRSGSIRKNFSNVRRILSKRMKKRKDRPTVVDWKKSPSHIKRNDSRTYKKEIRLLEKKSLGKLIEETILEEKKNTPQHESDTNSTYDIINDDDEDNQLKNTTVYEDEPKIVSSQQRRCFHSCEVLRHPSDSFDRKTLNNNYLLPTRSVSMDNFSQINRIHYRSKFTSSKRIVHHCLQQPSDNLIKRDITEIYATISKNHRKINKKTNHQFIYDNTHRRQSERQSFFIKRSSLSPTTNPLLFTVGLRGNEGETINEMTLPSIMDQNANNYSSINKINHYDHQTTLHSNKIDDEHHFITQMNDTINSTNSTTTTTTCTIGRVLKKHINSSDYDDEEEENLKKENEKNKTTRKKNNERSSTKLNIHNS
ncbi:hypothetical protein SNEBB_010082 [Seison nebaliae]|nr:hypothetical protein SNEBB_010082 [Seison nebaliae]